MAKLSKNAKIYLVYCELRDQNVPKQMAKSFARRIVENPEILDVREAR